MKILAIGGSNSQKSINKAFAYFTAQLIEGSTILNFDISQFDIPLFSVDRETAFGIPKEVIEFSRLIDETDLIILSLAENNGSFNVGFKNLFDWTSRIKDRKVFNNKSMLLMSTSPGPRGGVTVLESANVLFPYSGAKIIATFSLPEFYKNFDFQKGITNEQILNNLKTILKQIGSEIE